MNTNTYLGELVERRDDVDDVVAERGRSPLTIRTSSDSRGSIRAANYGRTWSTVSTPINQR
jgi:hypothetical protein